MTSTRIAALTTDRVVDALLDRIVTSSSEFDLVRTSRTWDELESDLEADLVLLDVTVEGAHGHIRELRRRGIRVIALTERVGEVVPAMAAGADAAPGKKDRTRDVVTHLRLAATRVAH